MGNGAALNVLEIRVYLLLYMCARKAHMFRVWVQDLCADALTEIISSVAFSYIIILEILQNFIFNSLILLRS